MLLPPRMKNEAIKKRQRKNLDVSKKKQKNFIERLELDAQLIVLYMEKNKEIIRELEETGSASFDAFLWQKELECEYGFFGSVIGYIDCELDQLKHSMNFEKSFVDENGTSEAFEELNDSFIELATRRESVVKDYQTVMPDNSLSVIDESVKEYPGHAKISKILADNVTRELQLPLQNKYVQAYNEGYMMNRIGLSAERIFAKYDEHIAKIKAEEAKKIKVHNA